MMYRLFIYDDTVYTTGMRVSLVSIAKKLFQTIAASVVSISWDRILSVGTRLTTVVLICCISLLLRCIIQCNF